MGTGQRGISGKKMLICVAGLGLIGLGSCVPPLVLSAVATQDVTSVDQAVGDVVELKLTNVAGTITVTTTDGDRITLVATKRVLSTTEAAAQAALDRIQIAVTGTDGPVLTVTVTQPDGTVDLAFASDFRIAVPADLKVTLDMAAGNVTATGLGNDVNITTKAGNVDLTGTSDNVTVRVNAGNVTATISPSGVPAIDLETDAGSVDLGVPTSVVAKIDAETNAGTLDAPLTGFAATNVDRGNAIAGGSLTADLNGGATGTIRLATDAGNVTLRGI